MVRPTEPNGGDLKDCAAKACLPICISLSQCTGEAKRTAFTSATIYVQASRDDGFPMSIVEAMRLGVPVAVTKGCDIAETIDEEDLGMLLSDDPSSAAARADVSYA